MIPASVVTVFIMTDYLKASHGFGVGAADGLIAVGKDGPILILCVWHE